MSFCTSQKLVIYWEAIFISALWLPARLKMALHFITGSVGRLPDMTSGWAQEDTDPTGYLCVTSCPFIATTLRVLACLHCFSNMGPQNKREVWVFSNHSALSFSFSFLPSMLLFRKTIPLQHTEEKHNDEMSFYTPGQPAHSLLEP